MSFSYSGNPENSALDEARFLIGDTDVSNPIMQDEEIQYIIDSYPAGSNTLKFHLFNRVATLFARDVRRSLGPQTEDPTSRLDYYKEQAEYYKGLITASGISLPHYAYPKTFRKGMHSNPPWTTKGGRYVR